MANGEGHYLLTRIYDEDTKYGYTENKRVGYNFHRKQGLFAYIRLPLLIPPLLSLLPRTLIQVSPIQNRRLRHCPKSREDNQLRTHRQPPSHSQLRHSRDTQSINPPSHGTTSCLESLIRTN